MKAAQIKTYGDASHIEVVEIPSPEAKSGQVVVEVHASSINPVDTIVREGYMKVQSLPVTLGGDIAGVIARVSDGSTFAVGDRVYGQASVLAGNSGAFAESAAVSEGQIAPMPNVSFEQAASLPLVGVSALQALTDHIALQPGQELFIHGGAGGIGSIAIQIAKYIGAYVATTATGDGIAFVKSLGADEVIDYTVNQFGEQLSGYDAVFDTVGGNDFTAALHILKPGGIAVSMVAAADDEALVNTLGITAITQRTQITSDKLARLTALVNEGVVTPQVDVTYSLEDIRQAFEARESGKVKGKVVLTIVS